jgi:hypothetical protein
LFCDLAQDFCLRYLLVWGFVRPNFVLELYFSASLDPDNMLNIASNMAALRSSFVYVGLPSAPIFHMVRIICRSIDVVVQGHPCTSSLMYQTLRDAVYHRSRNNIHIRRYTIHTQLEQPSTLDLILFSYNPYA